MEEKELLVIVPGLEVKTDCVFHLLVANTGEHLASHFCSHSAFAYGDLYEHRPERIEKWKERFGDFDVKYINQTDVEKDELLKRNKEWFNSLEKQNIEPC